MRWRGNSAAGALCSYPRAIKNARQMSWRVKPMNTSKAFPSRFFHVTASAVWWIGLFLPENHAPNPVPPTAF